MSGAPPTEQPAPWAPCSDRSQERRDPLWATAGRGDRWFLVELAQGWGPRALLDPPFDPDLGRRLVTRVESAGLRPLAIRRPGRRDAPARWRWALIDTRPGSESVLWGEVDGPADLVDVPLDGSVGEPSDDPVFAVCAHGRHDQCCAVRGRRAAEQLAAAYPEETWECSHLGGDRFAATMVLFPHGLAYGRVDQTDVADLAARYLEGRVDEEYLRGRVSLTHPVQAAQHFARVQLADDRVGAYPPRAERQLSEPGEGHERHRVVLDAGDRDAVVDLLVTSSEPLLSTCAATRPGRVREWQLESLELVDR